MVLSAARPDASLREFLAQRARSSSVARLAVDLLVALAVASATLLWWRPPNNFLILSICVALGAYGAWGLADRVRLGSTAQTRPYLKNALDGLCGVLTAAGIVAGAAILYGVWALALGTWIS